MYKVKDAGIKGLGIFATRPISRGTRILAEWPLFSVKSARDVWAASRKLQQADKEWFMQLSIDNNQKPTLSNWTKALLNLIRTGTMPNSPAIREYNTLLSVFRNNNFDIGDNTQAVFRDICRINHSCVPNSQGNFNTTIGHFTIHAVKPIDEEEEITISYLWEHGAPRDARQQRLWQGYGFTCGCAICDTSTPLGQKSNERRVQMLNRLREHAERASIEEKPDHEREMEILQELIHMFEGEGLAGRELSTMYLAAAEGRAKNGDRQEAHRFANTGLQIEQDCLGSDNPLYRESVTRMKPIIG